VNLCLFIAEPSKLEIRHEKMTLKAPKSPHITLMIITAMIKENTCIKIYICMLQFKGTRDPHKPVSLTSTKITVSIVFQKALTMFTVREMKI
jgi:hypothetical protein